MVDGKEPVSHVHDFLHRRYRLCRIRLRGALEILGVRHWHVGLMDAQHRRVEQVEAFTLYTVDDLGSDAGNLPTFLEHHGAIRLCYGRLDRFDVHRTHRAQVDDVDTNAVLR